MYLEQLIYYCRL